MGLGDLLTRIFRRSAKEANLHCPYKMADVDWLSRIERFQDCLSQPLPWDLCGYKASNWPRKWTDEQVGKLIRHSKDALNVLTRIRKGIPKAITGTDVRNVVVDIGGQKTTVPNLLFFYIQILGLEVLLGNASLLDSLINVAGGTMPEAFAGVKSKQQETRRLAYNLVSHILKRVYPLPRALDVPDPKDIRRLQTFYEANGSKLTFDRESGFYDIAK
ncbi:MAG: hypothetical protein ABIH86_00450 [Planctomycetota bacterium]